MRDGGGDGDGGGDFSPRNIRIIRKIVK